MKHLNRINQWVQRGKKIREMDLLTGIVVLIACFFVGAALHCHAQKKDLETAGQVIYPETENWGLGFGQEGEKPTGNVSAEELKTYHAAYMDPTDEKVIYLTFDAGYENGNTPAILEALKKHNAKGTFFVVGNFLETSPELVKQMVVEGHTVGNHTWHHPEMSKISDVAAFEKELKDVETRYQEITGEELTRFYRPPQGKYNTQNLQMASNLGYKTFFWSLAYVDWYQDNQPSREEAFDKLLGRIHPGAIVLLHNTSSTNAAILDELLVKWEDMGYHFGTLQELIDQSLT